MQNIINLIPSRAHRWINCTGSIDLELKYPRSPGPSALEGTEAHKIAHDRLKGLPFPDHIDSEMKQAIDLYVDTVNRYCKEESHYEKRLTAYVKPIVRLSGSPDVFTIDLNKRIIRVIDFKYGFGPVKVVKNWQMIVYLYLAAAHYLENGIINNWEYNYSAVIVQPRAYHIRGPVRIWDFSHTKMYSYLNKLQNIVATINDRLFTCNCGSWCRYCNALHACDIAAQQAGNAMDVSGKVLNYNLTSDQLSMELSHTEEALEILKNRYQALEEYAISQIKKGNAVPGWEMRSGRGVLAWNQPDKEIINMASMMGVDVKKPESLITPRQAEAAGLNPDIIKHYTHIKQSSMKLKRINLDEIKQMFKER